MESSPEFLLDPYLSGSSPGFLPDSDSEFFGPSPDAAIQHAMEGLDNVSPEVRLGIPSEASLPLARQVGTGAMAGAMR